MMEGEWLRLGSWAGRCLSGACGDRYVELSVCSQHEHESEQKIQL